MHYNYFVMNIKRQYIVNEQNQRIAVQVDIKTFEQIESVLENYALSRLMENSEAEETLSLEEAKKYYEKLKN